MTTGDGFRSRRYSAGLGLGLVLVILFTSVRLASSVTYAGPERAVGAEYFGMHIHGAASGTAWPTVQFAEWRLWDSGVAWLQLEPERGRWNFALLDRYCQLAAEHHVEIILTLGLTPTWASARPDEPSAYGKGNAAEPRNLTDWQEYVRAVATRYKGRIHTYEIWNEPNMGTDFSGTVDTMLQLSRAAYEALKSVDAANVVLSPSATTDAGLRWLDSFLAQGGCQYSDVIAYHFYVTPDPPEAMIPLIQKVQRSLRTRGCDSKPLWNTESGWAQPKHFSSEAEAAAYLMRTYVVNWLMGVQRCYWYAWDNHNWSTLNLTSPAGDQMTATGASYGTIRQWMIGAVLRSCTRERSGVWVCQFDRKESTSWILWSTGSTSIFHIPPSWRVKQILDWTGNPGPVFDHLTVTSSPVLLTNPVVRIISRNSAPCRDDARYSRAPFFSVELVASVPTTQ
jgi:Glycosyl hydrolases family 39